MSIVNYKGQSLQDKFVLKVLKEKKTGYFIEIGAGNPIRNNNTYLLETTYNWKGIMIEYDQSYLDSYISSRPNSIPIIGDASALNYIELFESNNIPVNIDYLQIDLDAASGITIKTINLLDNEIFNKYKFATITVEHDIFRTNMYNTRELSRDIFNKHGYVRVFCDVTNRKYASYEDWYVHPDLVDMKYINKIIEINVNNYNPVTLISGTVINKINCEAIIFDL